MRKQKLTKKLINEIKLAFEMGENLVDLAEEYNVNLSNLKYYSAKDKWEKGKVAKLVYAKMCMDETEEIIKQKKVIQDNFRFLGVNVMKRVMTIEQQANINSVSLDDEFRVQTRIATINGIKNYLKDVYNIRTPEQELEFQKLKLELEHLKTEAEKLDYEEESSNNQININIIPASKKDK